MLSNLAHAQHPRASWLLFQATRELDGLDSASAGRSLLGRS